MPISHPYKTIFVHIPKTGGGSLDKVLGVYGYDNKGSNRISDEILYGFEKDPNLALQHLTAAEIKNRVPAETFNTYFKFAFVRNPYARLVSEYHWMKDFDETVKKMNFKEFLEEYVVVHKDTEVHLKDQYKFITNEKEELIVDYVGRFENFDDGVQDVLNKVGLRQKINHLHKVRPPSFIHYSVYTSNR